MPESLINLLALTESQMAELVHKLGWPAYRAKQILRWLYRRRARAIGDMTDLSGRDRSTLAEIAVIRRATRCTVLPSDDGTRKLLLTLDDGLTIEAVLIPDENRLTLCVSTQVGCMLDCAFCLTGAMGLRRSLKAHEIIDQVLTAQDWLDADERITNLVFMGMGEPLANYEALELAVTSLTDKSWGLGWSPRRIVVSTAGLASRLEKVAALGVNLAVSLNATTEAQRRALMPAASDIASLKSLLTACRNYHGSPNRRLTFEYVLLAGVNDRPADARRLTALLRGLHCKVNLIPFNEFPGARFQRPSDCDVLRFQTLLRRGGIDAFIRKSRGRDVLGACGQLGSLAEGGGSACLTPLESRC
ncbi:23S rRNA (adenine(2503)-C(2))-methyltransferase RlmN [Candidatus Nitrospira inopinata]|jgi:23S rRNA (adenine2503-C2)-methyltransferase|uniref:Probable dual-specificity RNA methyltransferase RlmN n=1 Tax=Candidatus Nitrospira inopinata TaxID=1715989 RepID=A0A0S4KPK1_9BACT|nr:23S rRNA (adenine(2503)-C(2))-methyltransferase RlmN [Candidatus Nitrospira inopinata]CUQ66369.1 Dual-specificity RNA methyltransferase RlmN [Candidatus Nitrospira inopinata]